MNGHRALAGGRGGARPGSPPGRALPILVVIILNILPLRSSALAQFVLPEAELQIFKDCPDCPEMVRLPDGKAIGRTPVTRRSFAVFAKETGFQQTDWGCTWSFPEIPQNDDHPVVCLSWNDAAAYAAWLSSRTGKTYRLPTVEEVRYAALGGETTPYWWGADIGKGRANCRSCGSKWDGRSTAPAGAFQANRYGVLDAVGNVWLWTQTCHDDACGERMLIGGAWSSAPGDLRVSRQIWNGVTLRYDTYGLRVMSDGE